VHQVGLKDLESQKFSFLAFKGEAVGLAQILWTATVRDRRIFYRSVKFLKIRNQ
jgi:hypothetical protein